MYCPRLDHFVKLNPPIYSGGVVHACCHMVNPPQFTDYETMINSDWMINVKDIFSKNKFPVECIRCDQAESVNQDSIRTVSLKEHQLENTSDYLIVDLMLDNICNSACQFCSEKYSTKIGSLKFKKNYKIYESVNYYHQLPLERITQLDLTGGEPSHSKNIKNLLNNLPPNLKSIRFNTNGSNFIKELDSLVNKNIKINITISMDGTKDVHNYVRWPIDWDNFCNNVKQYKEFANNNDGLVTISFWSTLCALNINDFENMLEFSKEQNIPLSFSHLVSPEALSISFKNEYTVLAKNRFESSNIPLLKDISKLIAIDYDNQLKLKVFIAQQDSIRNIQSKDFKLV